MEIEIEGMKIEEVSTTKFLGTTVTRDNLIEDEINERIAGGNRASFANQKIIRSKLISKKTKMKLYKVSILSFRRVLYVVCFLLGISPASEV